MSIQARVLDAVSAPSEESKRFREKLETHFEDAALKEDKQRGELAFYFQEGLVIFRERKVEAETIDALIEAITELEEVSADEMLKAHGGEVSPQHFTFRVVLGESDLMAFVPDKMAMAKLLFLETGSLGAAELGMLDKAVLDFGENQWVISPAGVLIAGEIDDVTRCLYLVAQTMVGVATYMSIAEALVKQLYEAPPTFTERELSAYDGAMERLADTTSFVINDVRDEMLNADPRTVLIIRRLHEVMSVEGHEQRVNLFLNVAKRKVDRARAVKASRETKRFSAILFSFSMIVGISNVIVIFVNLTRNMGLPVWQGVLIELPIVILTAGIVIYLFKEIFQKTLKF